MVGRGSVGLCGQQRFGLVVRGEQRVESLAQSLVIPALTVEPGGALNEGLREGEANKASSLEGVME
jgi:hypothetical protein